MPTWFRAPAPDRPGTLNPCYDALDVAVVRGRADEVALRTPRGEVSAARLLEQVAALAGGLRALGVTPGDTVRADLGDPLDGLLVTLAALRLGAVTGDVADPDVHVTEEAGAASVLVGAERFDRDVVVAAGRQDPAPCADVEAGAPAYVVAGRVVTAEQAATDDSPTGRLLAALADGRPVEL